MVEKVVLQLVVKGQGDVRIGLLAIGGSEDDEQINDDEI